jgi:hypothetical protein
MAILDIAKKLEIISGQRFDAGRGLLFRIVSMLIKVVHGLDR